MRRTTTLGSLLVAAMGYLAGRWPGAVVSVTAWWLAPRLLGRRRRVREQRRLGAGLATVLELAARGVRTGMAPEAALAQSAGLTGGMAGELVGELVRRLAAGDPIGAARRWARAHDDPSVSVVAATVALVVGPEGGAARGFEAAATVLRERDRRIRDAESWAAQSRSSATLLVVAPLVLAAGSFVGSPGLASRVLAEPSALACMAVGAGFELMGTWWMGRLLVDVSGRRR